MKTKLNKVEYLVGYIEAEEFWAALETYDYDEAFDFLTKNQLEDADQDLARVWKMFEKTIKFTDIT
jgi:hypothetical protein